MRLVVFDVDGTLVDSQHHIHAAMTEAFEDVGLPGPTLAQVHAVIGLSLPVALARVGPELPAATVKKIVQSYRDAFVARGSRVDAPLFPGARDCLATLAARGDLCLGVATGKGRRGLDAVLEQHDLHRFFDTLQCADDHPSKPHPGMILGAMAATGATPEATMMVGDTSFHLEMARAAGVTGTGVAWGYHDPAALCGAGAAGVAADFPALTVRIGRWAA